MIKRALVPLKRCFVKYYDFCFPVSPRSNRYGDTLIRRFTACRDITG